MKEKKIWDYNIVSYFFMFIDKTTQNDTITIGKIK